MNLLDKKLSEVISDTVFKNELVKDNVIKDDAVLLNKIANLLTLRAVLKQKGFDPEEYLNKLKDLKKSVQSFDVTLNTDVVNTLNKDAKITVKGILPCPVRLPLMETIAKFKSQNPEYFKDVAMELNPASMGLDWLKESLLSDDEKDIPDLFISAGYDVFFDDRYMGKFKNKGIFEDFSADKEYADMFKMLKDPKNVYGMLAVVPAVFIVNEKKLAGRKVPTSWQDILADEFENSIALPLHDFDLFNAVLFGIYSLFGADGVNQLARNFAVNLHPSQMIKTANEKSAPAISVMPYFFTNMAKKPLLAVWPKEGAIVSPIFILSKKSKKQELKPLIDLFAGDNFANILAKGGYFPSVYKNNQNRIAEESNFIFSGWDFLNNNNVGQKLSELTELFDKEK